MISKNNKKKILFTEPVSDMGGVSFYILKIMKFLPKDKYEVHFAADGEGEMFNQVKNLGVITHSLKLNYNSIFSFVKSIIIERKFLKSEHFDIIHSHTAKSGFISSISSIGLDCIFIYTGHGWRHLQLQNYFKKSLIFLIEKYISIRANTLTFLYEKEILDTTFFNNYLHKSKVIPYSLDFNKLGERRSNIDLLRDRYNIPANAFVVSMVGRLTYQKDPETFVKTIAFLSDKISDIYGVWIGGGELKNSIIELAKKFKIEDKFFITDNIKQEEALNIVSASDVMLYTSKFEGLPLGVLESMAIGVPVVASDVGGLSGIIKDYDTGFLFKSGDYIDAGDKILKLYNDNLLMMGIVSNSQNTIKEKFSPDDKMSSKFLELYENLISKKYPTIGVFYQCYKRPKAFLEVMKSFRSVYPSSKMVVISDNGYDYGKIASKFNFDFSSLSERSCDGRQAVFRGTEAVVSWLTRLYEATKKIKEDYIIILEDDVLVFKTIKNLNYDLNGINPYEYIGEEVTEFLKERNKNIPNSARDYFYGGCGGSILRRDFILNNFVPDNFQKIADEIDTHIKGRHEHTYFSDYWLTLFVLYYGGSVGQYEGFCEKWHSDYWYRKNILNNISVLHQEKKYYNTSLTKEESDLFGNKFSDI